MAAEHAAVLAERNRIAGEIHDTLIQGVVGISANVELVVAELEDSPERARTLLDRLRILISNTLDEARRSVWNLRPASLEQRNLASALQDSAREAALNTPIQVKVQVDGHPRPLPGPTENNLLRIGQEAVNNAIKHSRARSVQMELHYEPAFVRLLVQDDGCGFDPQRPVNAAPDHFGLTAMRERAEKLGGRLFITSSPGEGAIIEAEIPGEVTGYNGQGQRGKSSFPRKRESRPLGPLQSPVPCNLSSVTSNYVSKSSHSNHGGGRPSCGA